MDSKLAPREAMLAAVRGLRLPEEERKSKLEGAHPEAKRMIEAEMSAIIWVLGPFLIWHEHGVLDQVLAYLKERVEEDTRGEVAA